MTQTDTGISSSLRRKNCFSSNIYYRETEERDCNDHRFYFSCSIHLLNSVFGGLALGTKATNLFDFGCLLRLAAKAASAAVGLFCGLATWRI